jgi:hypothetical protein
LLAAWSVNVNVCCSELNFKKKSFVTLPIFLCALQIY